MKFIIAAAGQIVTVEAANEAAAKLAVTKRTGVAVAAQVVLVTQVVAA